MKLKSPIDNGSLVCTAGSVGQALGKTLLALDCEFVGVRCEGGRETHGLARIAIVDENCQLVYHSFCKPEGDIVDYRTQWSGVREADLEGAPSFEHVQGQVREEPNISFSITPISVRFPITEPYAKVANKGFRVSVYQYQYVAIRISLRPSPHRLRYRDRKAIASIFNTSDFESQF